LERGIRPEAVILTADDHTLSKYRDKFNNKERSIIYSDYASFSMYYPTTRLSYLYHKYAFRFIPMLNPNNSRLFNKFLLSKIKINQEGLKTQQRNWIDFKDKKANCEDRKKFQFKNDEISIEMKDCLQDIIRLCKMHNIKLYGIKYPLAKTYIEVLGTASYHADSVFTTNGLIIFNYREAFVNHDDYFMNQDHLNEQGSTEFAKLLKAELK